MKIVFLAILLAFINQQPVSDSMHLTISSADFLKGFSEGIGETDDIKILGKCIPDFESYLEGLTQFINESKLMKMQNLTKGIKIGFQQITKLLNELTCLKNFPKLFFTLKLVRVYMKKYDSKAIALRAMIHYEYYLNEFNAGAKCISNKNYNCLGKIIGKIIKKIFLP